VAKKKQYKLYEGSIIGPLKNKILLNVDAMPKGHYELKIIENGKVIKCINFQK
jgi:hypothetical protein